MISKEIKFEIDRVWDEIEKTFCLLNSNHRFYEFLLSSENSKNIQFVDLERIDFISGLRHAFLLFQPNFVVDHIELIESLFNSFIYVWFFDKNRDFNFYHLVTFFCLSGDTIQFDNYIVELNEQGFFLYGTNEKKSRTHIPQRYPHFKFFQLNLLCENYSESRTEKEKLFHLRSLIQEVFLFAEEWEVANSLFASSFKNLDLEKMPQEEFLALMEKSSQKRDELTFWILESLLKMHQIEINLSKESLDFQEEYEVLQRVILGLLQKLFLPYSMNRMAINSLLIPLFISYFELRVKRNQNDFSSRIVLDALNFIAKNRTNQLHVMDFQLLEILTKHSHFHWDFLFDPSYFLKGLSWMYSKFHHIYFLLLCTYCYFIKNSQQEVSSFHLYNLEELLDSREFFRENEFVELVEEGSVLLSPDSSLINLLREKLFLLMENNLNSENEEMKIISGKLWQEFFCFERKPLS